MVWQSVSARPHKLLLAWLPIPPRLATARLKGTRVNLIVIAVYASTFDATEETKYAFYDDFQDAEFRVPAGNMLIVAVDTATWHILDKFAVGTRWANGDHLVNFASPNRLVVSSTRFQHTQRGLMVAAPTTFLGRAIIR